MSAFDNILEAIGGIGNAAGVQGDGPSGLNAMQRASLDPAQSAQYRQQSALAQLASDPNFQAAPPADQQNAILKVTGDPAVAQKVSALSQLAKMNLSNPRAAIQQGVQSGQIPAQEGIADTMNPMLQMSALAQLNAPPPAAAAPPAAATAPGNSAPAASLAIPPKNTGIDIDYLNKAKQLAPAAGLMAENMINGVFSAESGKGENDPVYNMALQIARRADPSFTPQALIGRPQMVKNSTAGDMYKLETSLNTGMQHLYDLHQMAPLTENATDSGWLPNVIGKYENLSLGGDKANNINRYRGTLNTAAPELAKYLGGGAAGVESTKEAKSPFNENLAPNAIQANATDMGAKMMAKGGTLQNEYNAAMGAAGTHKVVQPMTEALYADMQGKPLTSDQQQLVNAHRAESNLAPKTWANTSQSQPQKIATQADVAAAAQKTGKSIEQVTRDAQAKGYVIK